MPKGPRGEYRPPDVVGCAVHVGRIATGEVEDQIVKEGVEGGVYGSSPSEKVEKKEVKKE